MKRTDPDPFRLTRRFTSHLTGAVFALLTLACLLLSNLH